jgi:protein-disulfide isomerase-like protein with CxxC motif
MVVAADAGMDANAAARATETKRRRMNSSLGKSLHEQVRAGIATVTGFPAFSVHRARETATVRNVP